MPSLVPMALLFLASTKMAVSGLKCFQINLGFSKTNGYWLDLLSKCYIFVKCCSKILRMLFLVFLHKMLTLQYCIAICGPHNERSRNN